MAVLYLTKCHCDIEFLTIFWILVMWAQVMTRIVVVGLYYSRIFTPGSGIKNQNSGIENQNSVKV